MDRAVKRRKSRIALVIVVERIYFFFLYYKFFVYIKILLWLRYFRIDTLIEMEYSLGRGKGEKEGEDGDEY